MAVSDVKNGHEEKTPLYHELEAGRSRRSKRSERRPLSEGQRAYRKFRVDVYNYLDHPRQAGSMSYHAFIFIVVLLVAIMGALPDAAHPRLVSLSFYFEILLAIFFFIEFCIRLWAVGADAKYYGWRGRLFYLRRLVAIADILIISTSFFIIFFTSSGYNQSLLEKMRFLQILRLFHIDREMSTWNMVRRVVSQSSFELVAAYYISALLFLVFSYSVYEIETYTEDQAGVNVTDERTFPTYGHSMWFAVVSFLTIGYGDITPKHWLAKMATCFLAYSCYCVYVASSTLVSVAVTMLMADDTREKKKSKVRNMAARVIQIWYRYHLISDERFHKISVYKQLCLRLQRADESLKRSRLLAKKLAERAHRMQIKQLRKEKEKPLYTAEDVHSALGMAIAKNALEPMHVLFADNAEPLDRTIMHAALHSHAHEHPTAPRQASLPAVPPAHDTPPRIPTKSHHELLRHHSTMMFGKRGLVVPGLSPDNRTPMSISRRSSTESSSTQDDLDELFNTYNTMNSADGFKGSFDQESLDPMDIPRYRQLLRLLYYFMFRRILKKFKRSRQPYELMDAEAELCEMEHLRMQKFGELEARLEGVIGISVMAPQLHHEKHLCITERLQVCEEKLERMEEQTLQILDLAQRIAGLQQQQQHQQQLSQVTTGSGSSTASTASTTAVISSLPPAPPINPALRSKISKRRSRLARQSTLD